MTPQHDVYSSFATLVFFVGLLVAIAAFSIIVTQAIRVLLEG
jgi:hypothetical protein